MEKTQTAVTALFLELKLLAEGMRFSQDIESANLIDFICTREPIVLQWEKEQIKKAFGNIQRTSEYDEKGNFVISDITAEYYYEKTYGTPQ